MAKKSREKKERRHEESENKKKEIELYTINEASELLKVHPMTIRNWIKGNRIETIDISPPGMKRKRHRISREQLDKIIKAV